MDCPSCANRKLAPIKLEEDLPAYGCNTCEGAMVSLLYYRDWAERTGNLPGETEPPIQDISGDDTHKAMACPKCKRLMAKYLVTGQSSHRLDLCSTCDEVWLDGGEWQWLKSLQIEKELVSVLSDQWQRKVKQEVIDNKHRERFEKLVGTEAMEKAEEIRLWLKDHPQRQNILYYLGR